ncbi:MAG: RelA/SpoT domain protein [Clostridiales bacterium]|jgi:putative GTP pyrophosphokinase|nr:RelA/SpoT domain protein [Clostridiales bacterium]
MEIQLWREILHPYELATDEMKVKFEHIISECRAKGQYSPIEQVTARVKKISSILEKAQKKQISLDKIEDEIEDIAGIRIICQFVEDIDRVVDMIKTRQDMKVKYEKDYINRKKDSGYRSYHMIVSYNVHTMDGTKEIKAEIQIRTLAMNFWATIEHSLQYKYKGKIPDEIKVKLKKASDAIIRLDEEMSTIRGEVLDAQDSFNEKSTIVTDILNNIQNLYKVANKREIIKIQDEFYKLHESGDIDKLHFFNKQLDVIAEGYRAQTLK